MVNPTLQDSLRWLDRFMLAGEDYERREVIKEAAMRSADTKAARFAEAAANRQGISTTTKPGPEAEFDLTKEGPRCAVTVPAPDGDKIDELLARSEQPAPVDVADAYAELETQGPAAPTSGKDKP